MSASAVAGRYRLERSLGRGGMAAVHLAHDVELDRPVAVKVLAEHYADDADVRLRFLREAQLAARLSHPNVVSVYDAGEDDGRPYIVMEYVEGETLVDVVRREGRVRPERVVDLVLQACAGLEHAHSCGVVHRDVKPGNLLLRRDGVLKIADFGIARAADETRLTQAGTVLGTAAYLAPEQAAGDEVTAAADLYAVGVLLYELLTGTLPFQFGSLADLAARRDTAPVPVRDVAPDVPPALEDVVMRCLARNPEYRHASAAELAHDLAAASPEPPTEPLPERRVERATTVVQTDTAAGPQPPVAPAAVTRVVAVAAALAVALVAVVIALAAAGGDDGPAAPSPTVARGETPAEQARNLSEWLRDHARE